MLLPDNRGHFQLYSDTSQTAMGKTLYVIQWGKLKVIAYATKHLPSTTKMLTYSIIQISIKKHGFYCIIGHLP